MGLMNKVTAGIKNVDSKLGSTVDEGKYNLKIRDLERDIEDLQCKLGENVYKAAIEGETFDIKEYVEKIKSKYDDLEKTKKEKEEILAEAKAERDRNREEAK